VEAGQLTSNTRGRGMNTAMRADLAEAASALLSNDSPPGQVYNFTGLLCTCPELADTLTQVTGTEVRYRDVDEDEGALHILGRSGQSDRSAVAAGLVAVTRSECGVSLPEESRSVRRDRSG
jgi:NAD(P)H dehydrogenase (quinone)